jgi:hypothetical protein
MQKILIFIVMVDMMNYYGKVCGSFQKKWWIITVLCNILTTLPGTNHRCNIFQSDVFHLLHHWLISFWVSHYTKAHLSRIHDRYIHMGEHGWLTFVFTHCQLAAHYYVWSPSYLLKKRKPLPIYTHCHPTSPNHNKTSADIQAHTLQRSRWRQPYQL